MTVRVRATDGFGLRGDHILLPGEVVTLSACEAGDINASGRGIALDPAAFRRAVEEETRLALAHMERATFNAAWPQSPW